jgi:hypothetical protein
MLLIIFHCKILNLRISFKIGLLMCVIQEPVFDQLQIKVLCYFQMSLLPWKHV